MTKPALDLTDFAKRNQRVTPQAWLSSAPERDEIIAGYRSGVSPKLIYRWLLEERGYEPDELPLPGSLAKYLRDHVQRGGV
jgi:hypothetical protein